MAAPTTLTLRTWRGHGFDGRPAHRAPYPPRMTCTVEATVHVTIPTSRDVTKARATSKPPFVNIK